MPHASAIVVGAGMVGLALARALALRGRRVVVFERHERAVGASLRNTGAVTPLAVGDPDELDRARRSRAVWREFCEAADVWHDPCGCLVPATDTGEWALLQEYAAAGRGLRELELLDPAAARKRSPWLAARQLRGALFSAEDLLVDPRVALRQLPLWLAARHEIEFRWKHAVTRISYPYVWSGGRRHAADVIYVAGGIDTTQLLPDVAAAPEARRHLLVRLAAQPEGFRLGAIVANAAALALGAGRDAAAAKHLPAATPALRLVQSGSGELLLDAGHADADLDTATGARPALDALKRMAELPDGHAAQLWTLPQLAASGAASAVEALPGVIAVAAPGPDGFGMTTAFGFAEDLIAGNLRADGGDAALSARRA
ncbi:MAG TPA: FAD-dependent oxidoreductase [Tahibacter sp.]|uniref:FAD-dependent oxidoreductase n=1 Tax=Tahibacter sp. TaxID=2056211 RepID=UPI002CEAE82D|nr:FAD-dependent oxidoreductase [Tahibacter sp.]HSX58945.1 FAD-dependent oxidoreductase [Tahibacter sp.]